MELKELYNKTILGLIAGCLPVLVYEERSSAHPCEFYKSSMDKYVLLPANKDGSLNVRLISSGVLDVNIKDISTRDKLNVNIKELGGGFIRYNGPLNVKIDD